MVTALLAAAGSGVDSRIAKHRDEFSTWPAAVQGKVVIGQIDVGFTPQQERVALGEPDYVSTRTTMDGTSEVWGFRDPQPRFDFGIGLGFGRGSTAMDAGGGAWARMDFATTKSLGSSRIVTGHFAVIEEAKRR